MGVGGFVRWRPDVGPVAPVCAGGVWWGGRWLLADRMSAGIVNLGAHQNRAAGNLYGHLSGVGLVSLPLLAIEISKCSYFLT
jgi:hypothetical protein